MSGWVAEPHSSGVLVEGLEEFLLDDDRPGCGDRLNRRSHTWWCTRQPHAAGRHLATAGGLRVFAAWPGEHEPTAADLTEVSS